MISIGLTKGLTIYTLQRQVDNDTREREKLAKQYKKLLNGDNLDFKKEKDARAYLSKLPYKVNALTQRIDQNTVILNKLGY